jgi:hypothetical protein
MNNYDYKSHFGGIILINKKNNTTIFLQAGDDSSYFLDSVDKVNDIELFIKEYFDNIEEIEQEIIS